MSAVQVWQNRWPHCKDWGDKDSFSINKVKEIDQWSAPFVMAIANTRVVRRTAGLLEKRQQSYGSNFVYNEYMMAKKFTSALLITVGLAILSTIMFTPLRKIFRPLFHTLVWTKHHPIVPPLESCTDEKFYFGLRFWVLTKVSTYDQKFVKTVIFVDCWFSANQ